MPSASLADVSIYDRNSGQLLPVYSADGQRYIAGRPGNEYELRIRNNSGEDILAVVSVDGVNVVTGETAATAQSGYVISGWRSLSISGWRKSLSHVAAFYFTDHSDAYATRTGRPERCRRDRRGSVQAQTAAAGGDATSSASAVAWRPRRDARAALRPRQRRRTRAPAQPSRQAAEKSIGTGHGRNQSSQARYVQFERESDAPSEVIAIRYDTRANLVARGIIEAPAREPNPFPARFVAGSAASLVACVKVSPCLTFALAPMGERMPFVRYTGRPSFILRRLCRSSRRMKI